LTVKMYSIYILNGLNQVRRWKTQTQNWQLYGKGP
jgi:hypothetical protein